MVDYFAIGLTHGLIALVVWRLLMRDDLDQDKDAPDSARARPWLKKKSVNEGDQNA